MKNQPLGLNLKPITKAIGCALAFSSLNLYAADAPSDEEEADNSNRVIVTGSRIRVDELNDTIPVDVILAEDAIDRGITTVGELLRQSTLASGSAQVTSATSTAFVQNGGSGVETLSLRGLGANRTLVLLNGRRAGPAGVRGSVSAFDFNTIPLSAVERIEILKDGASSLYGSDAVAGVVNIILKEGEGGNIDFFASMPEDSGGERARLSGSWGKAFDNGNFRVTFDYDQQKELANGDRSYFSCGERYYFNNATGARNDIIDPRTGNPHCSDLLWGHVWLYDYDANNNVPTRRGTLAQFDYDGDLGNYISPPNPQGPTDFSAPPGWFLVNGLSPVVNADHPFQDLETHIPESSRATILLSGDIDFTDSLRGYSEVLFNRRETKSNGYRQFWSYIYNENFFAGNPLSAGWTGAQWFSPTAITDHNGSNITVDYSRVVLGLEGELGDWYWDLNVQASKSDADYTVDQIFKDSVEDQNWLSGSCVGSNTSVRGVPCIDIPWLDPQLLAGNISPEMRTFLFGTETGNTVYEQRTVEGTISGDLFEMPNGGIVGAAFGMQYQYDSIEDTPGEITRAGNGWGSSQAGITRGAVESYAAFGEVRIPFTDNLQAMISARYTDVPDAQDSATTYKAGLAWNISDELTFRGSIGTSFRAPGLFELFLADETSFPSQRATDPCFNWGLNLSEGNISQTVADRCQAEGIAPDNTAAISATAVRKGGFGLLSPETSDSSVWGLVWRPEDKDISVSLDYFHYNIEDEITVLGAANILAGCYTSVDFPNDPLCSQYTRNPTGDRRILTVADQYVNIAEQTNAGWDFKVDYKAPLPWGDLTLRTEHTFQKVSSRRLFPTSPLSDFNGAFGEPKHTGNALIQFDRNNWYVSWFVNYLAKTDNTVNPAIDEIFNFQGNETRRIVKLGSTSYHTASFGYDFDDLGIKAVIGVRNIFDKTPPRISRGSGTRRGNSAFYSQYDWIGRSVFLNLNYTF